MARPILQEIAQLLEKLADCGEAGAIDLRSLPMTDADRSELKSQLGQGEVHADLSVAGTTEVWETAYSGVWWVRHLAAEGRVAAEEIAVTNVPAILITHPADIAAAAGRFRQDLAADPQPSTREDVHHV